METLNKQSVGDWLAQRHIVSPLDAVHEFGVAQYEVKRLLDGLVERGAAERLRPVDCRHSRHDYYRSLEALHAMVRHDNRMILRGLGGLTFGVYLLNSSRFFRRAFVWIVSLLLLMPIAANASSGEVPDQAGNLATLDGLVGRWMELRTIIAAEKREWEEQRETWKREIALLEKEAEVLGKESDEGDAFASAVEHKRALALVNKERMEAELRKLRVVLDRAESDLRRWRAWIPLGLMPSLATGLDAIPSTQKEADKLSVIKRARIVAALYAQIETMQNQIHASRETLDVEGSRRQVDVLYIGLARAFAVSPGNDWVAIGAPSENGWVWTESSREADSVRGAIDVLNRKETARLVALPMQVVEEVKP